MKISNGINMQPTSIQKFLNHSLYALNRSKKLIPQRYLKIMYDSLIHSYLNFGIVLWGSTLKTYLNRLQILQKKALRAIHNAPYNAHTQPLFESSRILNLNNLYKYEIAKFMRKTSLKQVPRPIQDIYVTNINIHNHNTRQRNAPHIFRRSTSIAVNSIIHKAPSIWNSIPQDITNTQTEIQFKRKLKEYLLNSN